MDRIKTFTCGLANGFDRALKRLDELVEEELPNVEIISVDDRYWIPEKKDTLLKDCMSRRVVYKAPYNVRKKS